MKKGLLSLCLVFFAITAWAQTRTITGQVVGAQKDTIIGAVVIQKGTQNGTVTDVEGNFMLSVPDTGKVVLEISNVGFKTKQIVLGAEDNIKVTMDIDKADEVIVIGYGTVKKSDNTGAVSSLKPDDVKEVPAGNVVESIQGKAAGVDITRTSGEAGKAPNIVIRGNRSITAGNGPLYVVDGVQYSSIQDINPNDILSMEVLKDASSTAIYGSRGANGVIIVTTKKGAAGEPKVTLSSYIGISSPLAYPKPMTGQQYADLKLEAYKTQNPTDATPTYQEALPAQYYNNYINKVETNYNKEVLNKGLQKDIQLGISGGTDKFKTYFSLDYFNERGLLKNDNLDRYTGRLNLDYSIKKFLKVGTQTQITYYDQTKRNNPLGAASKVNPLTTPFNPNGTLIDRPDGVQANPLLDERGAIVANDLKTMRVFPTIYAEITPLKGLVARTNLAVNFDTRSQGIFNAANSFAVLNDNSATAVASHNAEYRAQLNWQGIINYNKEIKDHSFGITALSEVIKNKTEVFFAQSSGQLVPQQLYYNLADNKSLLVNSSYSKSALVSFAGRLNYSYKNRYLLTATGRTDGSSVLAEGNKWKFFPSIAAGWKVTEENFMKDQNIFSMIKLRGSWGIAGNANIDPYSTQTLLQRIPFAYDETGTIAYALNPQIGNKETTWERTRTADMGIDLGILKERITFSADYYNSYTTDLLLSKNLPLTTGVSTTVSNVGKTRNKGLELTLSTVNIQTKNFTWSTTGTFTHNKEEILALVDGASIMQITVDNTTKYVQVGSPVNSFYDYEKIGIWQLGQDAQANALDGSQVGGIRVKDQNGDGKITPDDRVVVGSTVPKWSAGLNSEFKYKNFDASFFLFARVGNTINYQYTYDINGTSNSLSTREYWTPQNPTNDLSRPGLTINPLYKATTNYVDGSFLKVRTLTLGYTLPEAVSQKFRISRLRVYVTGKNIFVLSKIKDYDPEMQGALTFPTVKLFVAGVNFEF